MDLINEAIEAAFLYEAKPNRSREEILAITGPMNDATKALQNKKRARMYVPLNLAILNEIK